MRNVRFYFELINTFYTVYAIISDTVVQVNTAVMTDFYKKEASTA